MKLKTSKVCLDCDEVFDGELSQCPKCASPAWAWINRWLCPAGRQIVTNLGVGDGAHK